MKLICSFILLASSWLYAESIQERVELSLQSNFGKNIEFSFSYLELTPEIKREIENASQQRFFRDKIYYWSIIRNDSTVAIAALDNVMGKAMPITVLVIFEPSGAILKAEIVKYRESIGGEVSNANWLIQFAGLHQDEFNDPNTRIDGISGATISVKAVSKGIKKMSLLYPIIKTHALASRE